MAEKEREKVQPTRIQGELLKRLEAHMIATERSASYIIRKALESYLPELRKKNSPWRNKTNQ